MTDARAPEEAVAEILATLASPQRLAILKELRVPRALSEIHVTSDRGGNARPASRQAVRGHLDRLLDAGMVVAREAQRPFGPTQEYIVNHQAIFVLAEEVRDLARMRALVEPAVATTPIEPSGGMRSSRPSFVLVKGVEEGRSFDLTPRSGDGSRWIIGRRRGAGVSLDYDPYVSAENSVVEWREGGHVIRDLPDSRNGTSVNFARLPPGGSRALRHGELVGVGRSLLLYWNAPDA